MSQVQDPAAASALIQAYGSTRFRFVDSSGCEVRHSPKDRADQEVSEETGKDVGNLGTARRGHTKIVAVDADGAVTLKGWAKRKDKPVFESAEEVLRAAQKECNGLIQRCSVRVGGARAVPSTRYADFAAARQRCREIAAATNQDPAILAANEILRREGKPTMNMTFYIGLHPELSLSDPEDIERAERVRRSVAEAIGQVCAACRSGDRDRIRYVLDQVGALSDSVSDPKVAEDVSGLLKMAEDTLTAISARGRAESAVARSNPETTRGQNAAQRLEAAIATARANETALVAKAEALFSSISDALETETTAGADHGPAASALTVEVETPIAAELAPEDLIASVAQQPVAAPQVEESAIEL